MEAAIDRLEQVSEELECHRDDHKVIVVREIKKVERKKMKIVQQRDGLGRFPPGLKETHT